MSKIIVIKGKSLNQTTNEILLSGGESYAFGMDHISYKTTVTWKIISEKNEPIRTTTKKWNETILHSIDKKLCGSYRYRLEATYIDDKETTSGNSIFIKGTCKQIIINTTTNIPLITNFHTETIKISLEAEGLNGNSLSLEIEFNNKKEKTEEKICVEGNIFFDINPADYFSSSNKSETKGTLRIKALHNKGYVKDHTGNAIIVEQEITIPSKIQKFSLPENNTMATVSIPDPIHEEERKPKGLLELTKIKIETTYGICSDEVHDFNDDKNFWILENKGKHYHWLKKTKPEDQEKLEMLDHRIPVIVHSTQKFKFHTEFNVLPAIETNEIHIRVTSKNGKTNTTQYLFKEASVTIQRNTDKGGKFTIPFQATNYPYANTIQYFENFELFFEYALPNSDLWIPLSKVYFRLYITWKRPLWNHFQDTGDPKTTMQIKHIPNATNRYILETLLWLGCSQAKECGNRYDTEEKNEEHIVDAIFNAFKNLKVVRAREGKYKIKNWEDQGMGYWRGISKIKVNPIKDPKNSRIRKFYDHATKQFIPRGTRLLLRYGEARCGEWAIFFNHILLCQGISLTQSAIYSPTGYSTSFDVDVLKYYITLKTANKYINKYFLVKEEWTINDSKPPALPESKTNRAQGTKDSHHYFKDHVFSLFEKKGILKWYDPSYGIQATINSPNHIKLLKNYTKKALTGILYFKELPGDPYFKRLNTPITKYKIIPSKMQKHLFFVTTENKKTTKRHDKVIVVINDKEQTIETLS